LENINKASGFVSECLSEQDELASTRRDDVNGLDEDGQDGKPLPGQTFTLVCPASLNTTTLIVISIIEKVLILFLY
jgi:hypothetical protein